MVDDLRESTARYHSLVEATTEGTLLVLDGPLPLRQSHVPGRCWATRRVSWSSWSWPTSCPVRPANDALWEALDAGTPVTRRALGEAREGCLTRQDGSLLACLLTLNPIIFDGRLRLHPAGPGPDPAALPRASRGAGASRAGRGLPGAGLTPRCLPGSQPGGTGAARGAGPQTDVAACAGRSLRRHRRSSSGSCASGHGWRGPRPRAAERDPGRPTRRVALGSPACETRSRSPPTSMGCSSM